MVPEPIIKFENVTRLYTMGRRTLYALCQVSLRVLVGEFVAVIGPSGSGKSTLLNMAGGIDKPTSGEVWVAGDRIDGMDENALAKWRRDRVGIVFQFFQLLPTLTALENVRLPMDFCTRCSGPVKTPAERNARAMHLLELVRIAEHAHKLPNRLSGGQQQSAAIARALANDPHILVTDEPTGNLDSRAAEGIFALLHQLAAGGKTVVMVTHDSDLARRAGRTITIADGQVI
jgi:putative ABC transport system ATP-binding protein